MIRACCLVTPGELRWIQTATARLSIQNQWEDAMIFATERTEELRQWLRDGQVLNLLLCDVSLPDALTLMKEARRLHPQLMQIPIADILTPPSSYVHPDIMPYALLWRPLEQNMNEAVMLRVYSELMDRGDGKKTLTVKTRKETWNLPLDKILYFEAREKKIIIRIKSQEIPFYETISHLEADLADDFIRCHKGFLVNQQHIQRIDWSNLTIELANNIFIPISRGYRNQVKERLNG